MYVGLILVPGAVVYSRHAFYAKKNAFRFGIQQSNLYHTNVLHAEESGNGFYAKKMHFGLVFNKMSNIIPMFFTARTKRKTEFLTKK